MITSRIPGCAVRRLPHGRRAIVPGFGPSAGDRTHQVVIGRITPVILLTPIIISVRNLRCSLFRFRPEAMRHQPKEETMAENHENQKTGSEAPVTE